MRIVGIITISAAPVAPITNHLQIIYNQTDLERN